MLVRLFLWITLGLLLQGCDSEFEVAGKMRVAMVTSETGLGDRSFNDMMHEGVKRARDELGIEFVVIQPRAVSEFRPVLTRAASAGFDVIIGSSFDMIDPMKAVASAFPDQKFGLVDVGAEPIAPNVASTMTRDWEGAFLVGVVAARLTDSGTIGYVGGKQIPLIRRIFLGYYYGAKFTNESIRVLETYTGTFTDPGLGKEYTLALINQGSDINFGVAGATSSGVIDAAKSTDTYAIGIDSNQNYMAPGRVLTSLVKHVDKQAYDIIQSAIADSFFGGSVKHYGLENDGVSIAIDRYNRHLISDALLDEISTLKERVASGEIVVPNYFELRPNQTNIGKPAVPMPRSILAEQ